MADVAIFGSGISALHLALFLQQHNVATTIYADKTAEQLRESRLPNNVGRFGATRRRERLLGVEHWPLAGHDMGCAHVHAKLDPPVAFRGDLVEPGTFVDFRLYLPALLADYQERGGVVASAPDPDGIAELARRHDLAVVAGGGHRYSALFPREADRSLDEPRRFLLAGFFHGIRQPDPVGLHLELIPGVGEIFATPVLSLAGRVGGITFEATPGGPWEAAVRKNYYDDPDRCARTVLELLGECDSEILDRIDRSQFALTRPLDLLQGAVTPTVRRPWIQLDGGQWAVAVGDGAVLNDPVTGQGGNLAAASAWELGRLILESDSFGEDFCRTWEHRLDQLATPVTEWANAALDYPPAHVKELLRAAARDQELANAYLNNFNNPAAMWSAIKEPAATKSFIGQAQPNRLAEIDSPIERERRFVDDLFLGRADGFFAPEAVVVTDVGQQSAAEWHSTDPMQGRLLSAISVLGVQELSNEAVLVTSRLDSKVDGDFEGIFCSSFWGRTSDGMRLVMYQQSTK